MFGGFIIAVLFLTMFVSSQVVSGSVLKEIIPVCPAVECNVNDCKFGCAVDSSGCLTGSCNKEPAPTDADERECGMDNLCPEGLVCTKFPGGVKCAKPNPCNYFDCEEGYECLIAESYPIKVFCSCTGPECATSIGDKDPDYYDDVSNSAVHVFGRDGYLTSHRVTIASSGSRGILQTGDDRADYENKLFVEDRYLFMKTSQGDEQINILPSEAIKISQSEGLSNIIVLKEIEKRPTYLVETSRPVKLFGLFSLSMDVKTEIDAENGDILYVKNPWWKFFVI